MASIGLDKKALKNETWKSKFSSTSRFDINLS